VIAAVGPTGDDPLPPHGADRHGPGEWPPAGAHRGSTADDVTAGHHTDDDPTGRPAQPGQEVPWQRLDARMIAVDVTRLAGALVPLGLAVLLRNADAAAVASTLTTLAMVAAASAVFDLLRWATTWYRITGARVEVRTGLITRRHRSMPRDRIRRVDATAKVLHRAFGLSVVTLATGEHAGSSDDVMKLDAVTTGDAAALRRRLLGAPGSGAAAGPVAGGTGPGRAEPGGAGPTVDEPADDRVLASLSWRWAPYDVLSFWTLAIPAVALGAVLQGLQSIGVSLDEVAEDDRVTGAFRDVSVATGVGLVVAAVAAVGVAGALALFVETWWGFRLVREPAGRLRIHRGLLTTRSISLDEARLRGIEVAEPLLLRAAGGARLHAVTTGLVGAESSRGERADALMPPAPAADVQRVAAAVLGGPVAPTDHPRLRAHPAAARRRRLTRAAAAGLLAWAVLAAVRAASDGVPLAAAVVPATVTIVVGLYAFDAYRNLGHGLAGAYLVVRRGSLSRRTVALQRTGVIGWTVRRTVFQRRLGLATVEATTAAGRGSYPLSDVDAGDGLRFAEQAVPGVLAPFLADG
jgi:putative membrane protein